MIGFCILAIAIGEGILILHTRAIWDNNVRMTVGLISLYVSGIIITCVLGLRVSKALTFSKSLSATAQPGCLPITATTEVGAGIWLCCVIVAFGKAVIMFLTLWKSIRGRVILTQSTVFRRIYRDGILFYAGYFALSVVVTAVTPLPPHVVAPKHGFLAIYRVLYTILSTRLLLSLRETACSGAAKVSTCDEFGSELIFTTRGNSSDSEMDETSENSMQQMTSTNSDIG